MLSVSTDFKAALHEPIKRVSGYIVLENSTEIRADGDLVKYSIDATGGLLKSSMAHFKGTLLGQYDTIKGQMIDVYYGVYHNDAFEYVLRGKFTITDATYKKDTNTTELEGYDNMLQFQKLYVAVSEFPVTLFDYLQAVCTGAGVILNNSEVYNGSLDIPLDYYVDISDTTFRDVLEDICEATGTNARILPNGELKLETIVDTGVTLSYDNLLKYSLGDKFGSINSVVLSRQPQNDDVFLRDEADIATPTNRNILDLSKFKVTYSAEEA